MRVGEGRIRVELSVDCDNPVNGLEVLSDWLAREPSLRGRVTQTTRAPQPGTLGTISDALVAAAGSGGVLTVLAGSLKTFLSQPRRSDIRITLTSQDGTTLEIDAKRVADVESLIRETFGRGE